MTTCYAYFSGHLVLSRLELASDVVLRPISSKLVIFWTLIFDLLLVLFLLNGIDHIHISDIELSSVILSLTKYCKILKCDVKIVHKTTKQKPRGMVQANMLPTHPNPNGKVQIQFL